MKNILGLDLGTNSIGWAMIEGKAEEGQNSLTPVQIKGAGSRIIPMTQDVLTDFAKGNSISQTIIRTGFRGTRRLRERQLLRRDRLHRVLDLMGYLPAHYAEQLDRYGHILDEKEPKLAWFQDETKAWCFLFQDSFNEMLADFAKNQPNLVAGGKKVPYDWTIYYLRKKALTQPISNFELAWLLLHFNQKRGYYQLRGEDDMPEESENKKVEYLVAEVLHVEEDKNESRKKDEIWYNVHLDNGMIYHRKSKQPLDSWVGKKKEFIVTTTIQKDGTSKPSFSAPKEDDWGLMKIRTEKNIDASKKTVGAYIYDTLLDNPDQKIIGKLVKVVERKYYKDELKQILEKQREFHKELLDKKLCEQCYENLYSHNPDHRKSMLALSEKRGEGYFTTLFIDDILFYQRPLKSKKSLISDCQYEYHTYRKDGKEVRAYQKCIAKSHPLFQEFRLLQFLKNLRIIKREEWEYGTPQGELFPRNQYLTDIDVTNTILNTEEKWEQLYDYLNQKKEIKMKDLLSWPVLKLGKNPEKLYRWNYVEDKTYPGNETHAQIISYLVKAGIAPDALTEEDEYFLWEILYSVNAKDELEKALESFAKKHGFDGTFVDVFKKSPAFPSEYGSYSAKAIKKLLPLMRFGNKWNEDNICTSTKERIEKLITGEFDEKLSDKIREKIGNELGNSHKNIKDFKFMPLWLACYIVYGRHSEAQDVNKWESPEDIDLFLKQFKQYSLRNPIVEQVVLETLRTVRDIWRYYGSIDEIHLEMGRDLKNPADKRKAMTERNIKNEQDNYRIKALLTVLANELNYENARDFSPSQQEILRIFEETAIESFKATEGKGDLPEDIKLIIEKFKVIDEKKRPTTSDVKRYALWLEQKYQSPYTGQPIKLSRLFTSDYEIEHVIPQSRYFDDSFSNKVICEAAVNKLKSNMLGLEFIKKHHGQKVEIGNGKFVTILSEDDYKKLVDEKYKSPNLKTKRNKLLMDDIPDGFIERQMNDSRYISKLVKGLLSNIVRTTDSEGNLEPEAVSKNLITTNGAITDMLKRAWGVNDVWNKIILPRFQRMNKIDPEHTYTAISAQGHEIPSMPAVYQYGFNKKRIDHRHHAMDAIVIACANRDIVNYLNNDSARDGGKRRYDLMHKLCNKKKDSDGYERMPRLPWSGFCDDVYNTLEGIIVSFKQNLRVINKATNKFVHYNEEGKKFVDSQKGVNWAVRKSMHKDTVFGLVSLRKEKTVKLKEALSRLDRVTDKDLRDKLKELVAKHYNENQIKVYFEERNDVWKDVDTKKIPIYYYTEEDGNEHYYATRFLSDLTTYFNGVKKKEDAEKKIEGITDTGIQKILLNHITRCENNVEYAFSPEGIDDMNSHIVELNDGKPHKPIYKVRRFECANKFAIGQKGNKKAKYVEGDKGTNLFFAAYEGADGDRNYITIPFNEAYNRLKQQLPVTEETDEKGRKLVYILSPNDLVILSTKKEDNKNVAVVTNKVFKMVSAGKYQCMFIPNNVSSPIVDKVEFTSKNKYEKDDVSGLMIKANCVPIKVDRLGHIVSIDNKSVDHD